MLTLGDINEMFPTTMDGDIYSDVFKNVYGCRPRNVVFEDLSSFHKEMEELSKANERAMETYYAEQKEAIEKFEVLVKNTIALGASDRESAIEWIRDGEDARDLDELEYIFNLPWAYLMGDNK